MPRVIVSLLLLSLGAARGFAHNAFESTATARLFPDRLEIKMTTGLTTARTIDANGGDLPIYDPAMLPALRRRFLAGAGTLFEATSRDTPLALTRAEVAVDAEDEVHFLLVYPRPSAGPLLLRAAHVAKQPYGGTILTIQGEREETLATALLMADELVLNAIAPPSSLPPPRAPWSKRSATVAVVSLALAGAWVWQRSRSAPRLQA